MNSSSVFQRVSLASSHACCVCRHIGDTQVMQLYCLHNNMTNFYHNELSPYIVDNTIRHGPYFEGLYIFSSLCLSVGQYYILGYEVQVVKVNDCERNEVALKK